MAHLPLLPLQAVIVLDQQKFGMLASTWDVESLLATFLSVWWAVGAGVLTFLNPDFISTSNAYFATYAALVGSFSMLAASFADAQLPAGVAAKEGAPAAKGASKKAALLGLFVSSLIVLIACAAYLQPAIVDAYGVIGEAAYGIAIAALTLLIVIVLLVAESKLPDAARLSVALFLAVVWTALVGATTFSQPFTNTGNGFFAAWVGLYCAFLYARDQKYPAWFEPNKKAPGKQQQPAPKKQSVAAAAAPKTSTVEVALDGAADALPPADDAPSADPADPEKNDDVECIEPEADGEGGEGEGEAGGEEGKGNCSVM